MREDDRTMLGEGGGSGERRERNFGDGRKRMKGKGASNQHKMMDGG